MSDCLGAPQPRKSMKQCKNHVTSSSHGHKTSNIRSLNLLSASVTETQSDGPVISDAWSVHEAPNHSHQTMLSEVYDANGIEVPHPKSYETIEAVVMTGQEKDIADILPDLAAGKVLYSTDKLLNNCSGGDSHTHLMTEPHESYTRITMDILIPQLKFQMPSLTSSLSNSNLSDEPLISISFAYEGLVVMKKSFVKCSFAVGQNEYTMERNHEIIHTPVGRPERQAMNITKNSSDAEHDQSTEPTPFPIQVKPVESDVSIGLTYEPLPVMTCDQPKLAGEGNAWTKNEINGTSENLDTKAGILKPTVSNPSSYQSPQAVDSDDNDDLFPSNYKQTHVPRPVLSQAYPKKDTTAGSLTANVCNPFAANPIQVLTKAQLKSRRSYQAYKTSGRLRNYTCKHCSYTTPHSGAMTGHRYSHATEKSHICTYPGCDFKSANPHNLQRHLIKHSGEKPHLCDLCGKAFALKTILTRHKLTHGIGVILQKCDLCDYTTYDKGQLRRHKLTHTGEKPFKCSQCSYATSQKYNLVSHNRIHSGEKPYKCKHCHYEAAHKSSMNSHVKCKHPCDSESVEQLD